MDIEQFKREHADLLSAVTALRELVQSGVQEHAQAILGQLVTMSATIKLHLAAEDRVLYPALASAADLQAAETGKRFQDEMGDLAQVYAAFASRWNLAAKISKDPDGFRSDANNVFKALHLRVQRENRELYPLAERL
jgi:iron-sulfur cluster repair protein YtfE (RIC family)